jgi:hypothetical protein
MSYAETKRSVITMPCHLLHMIEVPNNNSYADEDVKDIVGQFPQLFCAAINPPVALKPSESARCLEAAGPCWKPAGGSEESKP